MAKAKGDSGISEERLSLYDELIIDLKGIERPILRLMATCSHSWLRMAAWG